MIFATFTPAPDYIVTPALYLQGRAQDWKLEGERVCYCASERPRAITGAAILLTVGQTELES